MKLLTIISLIAVLFGSGPVFNPPTIFPENLDHLYQLVETGQGNWVFSACRETPQTPYINWSQLKAIQAQADDDHGRSLILIDASKMAKIVEPTGLEFPTTGKLNISESTVFSLLFLEAIQGNLLTCALPGEKVTIHGNVQHLFDQFVKYVD